MVVFAYRKVYQPNIYIYLLFFGFPSHVGHHRTEILRAAAETKTLDGLRCCPTADSLTGSPDGKSRGKGTF